jgi:hypothetical protein
LLNFTFGINGTTSTATLTTNSGRNSTGCNPGTSTQSFTILSLNPNGSGKAGLTCGKSCGWTFDIQVIRGAAAFNLVDVTDGNNYVEGTAIRQ